MKEKELKINIPEGYEIDKENSTFERIIFKKKYTYPKSWKEFCENNKRINDEYFISHNSIISHMNCIDRDCDLEKNLCKTKEEAEAFLALIQLKRLWHEYVDDYSKKVNGYYCIDCFCRSVLRNISSSGGFLFKFPTKELAEEFLNNFKDLLIKASPLWK